MAKRKKAARKTAVARRAPTAVAEERSATVALSATFVIQGNDVTINTGDITKLAEEGFKFRLTEPLVLGTVGDFTAWLAGPPLNLQFAVIDWSSLPEPFNTIEDLRVTITVFAIDSKAGTVVIGVKFTLPGEGFKILPGLWFKEFGVVAGNGDFGEDSGAT